MKIRYAVLALVVVFLILGGILFYLEVGGLMLGQSNIDGKRMGYGFDVALNQAGERLFLSAGQSGLHILNTDHGKMEYFTSYHDDGYYRNLKIKGERAYLADSRRGLVVLDISGAVPVTTWVQTNGGAGGLHLDGDTAYVAAFEDGLQIFDIADPDSPVLINSLPTPSSAWDVWVQEGYAYLADFNQGMIVIDVSTPVEPYYIGTTTWREGDQIAEIIRGEGDIVAIAAGPHGLFIIDISDPVHPVVVSNYKPTRLSCAEGLAVRNGILYLALGSEFLNISTIDNGLHILDITKPDSPKLLSKVRFQDWVEGVYVDGDFAYVANTWTGARSIDVGDLANPFLVDTFNQFP